MKFLAKAILTAAALIFPALAATAQNPVLEPDGTYVFAQRDTCDLYMDVYHPAFMRSIGPDGTRKPTILFVFGGGFKEGSRNEKSYLPWFKKLTDDGYGVISIDYRLGLKDAKKMGPAQARLLEKAIHLAVEDLYSATAFILENSEELGVEPDNIVIAGSSAGAITVLQADWELCNRSSYASVLPEDFHYAGVMSFAGAIFSEEGLPAYKVEPAPTMLLHGTSDKLVTYKKIRFLNLMFAGTEVLAPVFLDNGYNVNVLRFKDRGHEISVSMTNTYEEQMRFLETNVMLKQKRIVDAIVDDPSIPVPSWAGATADDLYN